MKDKLEILRLKKNLSASALAKTLGVEASAISHIKSGRNKPSYDFVVKILRAFPDVNPDWLLLDSPDIFRESEPASLPTSTSPIFDTHSEASLFDVVENREISEDNLETKNEQIANFSISQKLGKRVERVIVLYSDGSFDSYETSSR